MNSDFVRLTETFSDPLGFAPKDGSVYVCGRSKEQRSEHYISWLNTGHNVSVIEVIQEDRDFIMVRSVGCEDRILSLRSQAQLRAFWNDLKGSPLYLDITGLRHSSWAGLLRGLYPTTRTVKAVYVEPRDYRMSPQPTENEIYDLS